MAGFRRSDNSMCERVLDLLKAGDLKLREDVVRELQ